MSTGRADLVVVGGGIVGLATAYRLLDARPSLRLVLLEKEPELAAHQTGRNSGVIHSPNTYAPGSLKARLCSEGKAAALRFADEHGIPYEICGELIVATTAPEIARLAAIAEKARANGVDARELTPAIAAGTGSCGLTVSEPGRATPCGRYHKSSRSTRPRSDRPRRGKRHPETLRRGL